MYSETGEEGGTGEQGLLSQAGSTPAVGGTAKDSHILGQD